MSEQLHPGLHPDADSLNAFIEGVLPEHERLQCLAHFAECPQCREVVFLAGADPQVPEAVQPVAARRRWFAPVPVLAAAAAVCVAALGIWLYLRNNGGSPARETVAQVSQPPVSPQPAEKQAQTTQPSPTPKTVPPTRRFTPPARPQDATPPNLPAPPVISALPGVQVPLPSSLTPVIQPPQKSDISGGLSGILATVIDPSGGAIPGANVKVRQLDGTTAVDGRTDSAGQFHSASLPAGRYELRIEAPGFRQTSMQVELQPREVASIKSELNVGSVSETVEVTAAASTIQASSASTSLPPRKKALPDVATTVTSGKISLAVDAAGGLLISRNSGKSWKIVKPVWPGKVRTVAADIGVFRLTTDSGSTWLSRDGAHWRPKK